MVFQFTQILSSQSSFSRADWLYVIQENTTKLKASNSLFPSVVFNLTFTGNLKYKVLLSSHWHTVIHLLCAERIYPEHKVNTQKLLFCVFIFFQSVLFLLMGCPYEVTKGE